MSNKKIINKKHDILDVLIRVATLDNVKSRTYEYKDGEITKSYRASSFNDFKKNKLEK